MDVLKPTSTLPKSDIDFYLDELKKKLKISDKKLREIVNRLNDTNEFDGLPSIAHFIFESIHSDDGTRVKVNVEEFVSIIEKGSVKDFVTKSRIFWELTSIEYPLYFNDELASILGRGINFLRENHDDIILYGNSENSFNPIFSFTRQLNNLYPIPKYGNSNEIKKNLEEDGYRDIIDDQLKKHIIGISTSIDFTKKGDLIRFDPEQISNVAAYYFQIHPNKISVYSNPFRENDIRTIENNRENVFKIKIHCLETCQIALMKDSFDTLFTSCINKMCNLLKFEDIDFFQKIEKQYDKTSNLIDVQNNQILPFGSGGIRPLLTLIQHVEEQLKFKTIQELKRKMLDFTKVHEYGLSYINEPNYLSLSSTRYKKLFDEATEIYLNSVQQRYSFRENFIKKFNNALTKCFDKTLKLDDLQLPLDLHLAFKESHKKHVNDFIEKYRQDNSEYLNSLSLRTQGATGKLEPKKRDVKFKHNEDFSTVWFDEVMYTLSNKKAEIVKVLYSCRDDHDGWIHEVNIFENIPRTSVNPTRMHNVFSNTDKFYKERIDHGDNNRMYRLILWVPIDD